MFVSSLSSCTYQFSSPRYGLHRALRSFPTRRSSDLWPVGVTGSDGRLALPAADEGPFDFLLPDGRRHKIDSLAERIEDRKSTRLNSSHLVISYAVFCLKKKKHINNVHVNTQMRSTAS